MLQTIGSFHIDVNDEGYLTDPEQWTPELAHEIAKESHITLTDAHFEVLHYIRGCYLDGVPLSIRRVGKSGLVSIKEFYALFPGGPLKTCSKIAGIPKPASCV